MKAYRLGSKPYFVPESKEIDDLLSDFEKRKITLAIVVDEYGDVKGIVTVDDILEEIVGDIFDKSERKSVFIKKVNPKLISVDARISVEEINENLHLGLEEGHFNTLAGFIEHKLQRIPKKGENIELGKVTVHIDKATNQGIERVHIIKN